ncbi:MAG: histidine kinase [Clostridia bacterium]
MELENKLEDIVNNNSHLLNDSSIIELVYSYDYISDYDKVEIINNLTELFATISQSNDIIKNSRILIPKIDRVYNSNYYDIGNMQILNEVDYEYINAIRQENQNQINYYYDPITQVNVMSIMMSPISSNPDFIIEFVLDTEEIKDYLESYLDEGESYILSFSNGYTISNIKNIAEQNYILTQNLDTDIYTNDYSTYISKSFKSEVFNFSFLGVLSTQSLNFFINMLNYITIAIVLLCGIAIVAYTYGISKHIRRPLQKLSAAFEHINDQKYYIQLENAENPDFEFIYNKFNKMASNLNQLITKDYHNKILIQKSELKQLQAQINPHFLYNSFFILQRMIVSDVDKEARDMANKLAKYFNYITRNSKDSVPLKFEYEHAKIYSDIQSIRFEGRIEFFIEELPKEFENTIVPRQILQPILENVFNHGLKNKESDGVLRMSFEKFEKTFNIVIEDNGEDLDEFELEKIQEKLRLSQDHSEVMEMSGMLNINKRLVLFSNEKIIMELTRSELGGLKTSLRGFEYV